jgi:alpha-D-xyloside xylohydrolase
MRPMVMDFKNDATAIAQSYEYMFGKSFLVAPITEAGVNKWNVYLPKSTSWYDFWTARRFTGGQTIKTDAPQDKIPLYVKAGSVIPVGPNVQYATEKNWDNLEIRVYPGANGKFVLYEDENDNYNYEKGIYSIITFNWDEAKKTLTISDRNGSFSGMLNERKFNVVIVSMNKGLGDSISQPDKVITYAGKKITVNFKK